MDTNPTIPPVQEPVVKSTLKEDMSAPLTPKKKDTWWDTLRYAVIALIIVIPIRIFIAEPFVVSGHSMDPTFASGQYIIIDEVSYKVSTPNRGEVVVFKPPFDLSTYYIKRIIGLPGETVSIKQGVVSIKKVDGTTQVLKEPYLVNTDLRSMDPLTLTNDQYFVLGDNRPVSSDSRIWGALPKENIVGSPFVSLFPLNKVAYRPGGYEYTK